MPRRLKVHAVQSFRGLWRLALVVAALLPLAAAADDDACTSCHAALTQKKSVHGIFNGGGCSDCHAPDAKPSKCGGAAGKGWKLVADEPALCVKCHDMSNKTPLHPVIDVLGCTACHDPHASDNPSHLKIWPAEALCYSCHERKDSKKEVHTAVKQGRCLGCHDPHSGAEAPLLKKPRAQLCLSCHELAKVAPFESVHTPVRAGNCLGCHDPHSTDNPKHLKNTGSDLCLACHDPRQGGKPGMPSPERTIDLSKKDVHPVLSLGGECMDCHAPHGSPNAFNVKKPLPALCYSCHDRMDGEKHTHSAVLLGRCVVCHDPHSSDHDKLLRADPPSGVCFRCHSDDVSGRKYVHFPVAIGECTLCHDPHGAKNDKNLKSPVPQLCESCHVAIADKKNVHGAITRYGCTACHDPHGGPNPHQLKAVPNKLCLTCHTKITGDHVFVAFDGRAHPLEGKPDPVRRGQPLSCISCHDPHSSDHPKLWRQGEKKMELCTRCHAKR